MKRKQILSIVLAVLMIFGMIPFSAFGGETVKSSDEVWTMNDFIIEKSGEETICKGFSDAGKLKVNKQTILTIPDGITHIWVHAFDVGKIGDIKKIEFPNTLKVIDGFSFYKISNIIEELTIPDSVTSIEYSAFMDTKIKKLKLGSGLKKVENRAFWGSAIENLTLSEGLEIIGELSFSGNKITKLSLPSTVKSISGSAFSGNYIEELIIPDNVFSIAEYAFDKKGIKKLTLGKNLRSIGKSSFRNNKLIDLKIPEKVNYIGKTAFEGNPLKCVEIYNDNTVIVPDAFPDMSVVVFKSSQKLADAKTKAKDEITKMPKLTDEQVKGYQDRVDKATTPEAVQAIVDEAKKASDKLVADKAALEKAKIEAIAKIDALKNLTEEEKTPFKTRINEAKDIPTVDTIVSEATAEDTKKATLKEAKDNAKKAIEAMDGLTTEEKKAYEDEIDKSTTPQEVQDIVDRAKEVSDKAINDKQTLDQAKEDAKKIIDELKNLTPEEKNAAKKAVDEATNKAEVDNALDQAKKLDELNKAKKDAKAEIDADTNIPEDKKNEAKDAIDKAKDKEDIDKIVEEAKNEGKTEEEKKKALDDAKDKAKGEVDKLDNLSPEEKDKFKKDIDNATDKAAVDKIVENAKNNDKEKLDAKTLDEAKENAKKVVDELKNLTKEEKETVKKLVDEAKDKETIDKIVKEARAKDAKSTVKDRDELIKDLRDLLDKVERIKDPSRKLERAIDEAYKVLFDKESTSKDIEEAISKIKDIVKRERYDLDDYRLEIDNVNIDSKSISGRTESKWYVDIYSGRTRIGRGEADRRGYFDIKLNNYTLKKNDKIKVVASDPDDDDKYVEKKVSINDQNTINLNNIDTKTLLNMLSKGEANTNNNEYAIFPVGQNYYLVYNNMTPNKVTMDAKTFIRNNRTMVPLRYIAYTLGFNVEYNNATREAIFTNTSNDTLTKKSLRINIDTGFIIDSFGKVYTTDSKPVIINNRIYAPIANIARFFDATQGTLSDGINNTIEWDPVNYLVYVYRNVR